MGVREGGSYVADTKGEPRLVERTDQPSAHRVDPTAPATEVTTAPAPAEPAASRLRGGSETQPQE